MQKSFKQIIKFIVKKVSAIFLSGLFTLLPILLTIALFRVSFQFLKKWLHPVAELMRGSCIECLPHFEIILTVVCIFLFGIILRFFLLRSIIHKIESIITKIPLVRPVYAGIKQLVQAFSGQDKLSFKKVVLIEFPSKGMYSLGFLTSEMLPHLSPDIKKRFYNVFIPTTPNPTTGFFIMIPEADIVSVDLSRQEAMALIISGGIIQPEKLPIKNCDSLKK